MLPENRKYFAALYMRLSKDDEGKGESASITTQRKMLRAYAAENHYPVYDLSLIHISFTTSINLAAKGGAKVVVCPGYLYEIPVHTMQQKHPEVKFIILDGTPHSADSAEPDIGENTASIYFAEEQAGFLAGYAAVYEGCTKLGFMGGIAVPAVIRYGYGFIQGADYAAKEKGMAPGSIDMKYTYVGNFEASPENMAKAASWYNEGTEAVSYTHLDVYKRQDKYVIDYA